MSLIFSLPSILEDSRNEYERLKKSRDGRPFFPLEQIGDPRNSNLLAQGDNLAFIRYLLEEKKLAGKLRLAYLDPPFYSKASYEAVIGLKSEKAGEVSVRPLAYEDRWKTGAEEYLRMLCVRFFFLRDLLSEEGCLWVHLDWHVVHYVKLLLDAVFGEKNFINEVIWQYKSGGTGKRSFSKKHDTLLFYGKSGKYYFQPLKEKSYNRGRRPYRFKGVREYEDEGGWYTMVNMKDVWQIDMVGRTSAERTGYATQKPEKLMERIIESCSRPGDWCADFFCGSGSFAAAAEKLGRKWIACDAGAMAAAFTLRRMAAADSRFCLLSDRPDKEGGELNIKLETSAAENRVTVTLRGYTMDRARVSLKKEELEKVNQFREKDPLALLEYWSVDFHYNGSVHRPRRVLLKENGKLRTVCEGEANTGKISVCAVDVFGNRMRSVLDIEEVSFHETKGQAD